MRIIYSHLSHAERVKIERWRRAKVPVERMAADLERHRSTLFRELKRNHFEDADCQMWLVSLALLPTKQL